MTAAPFALTETPSSMAPSAITMRRNGAMAPRG
jgi:hypothetical protein